jgi:hypothetical protein
MRAPRLQVEILTPLVAYFQMKVQKSSKTFGARAVEIAAAATAMAVADTVIVVAAAVAVAVAAAVAVAVAVAVDRLRKTAEAAVEMVHTEVAMAPVAVLATWDSHIGHAEHRIERKPSRSSVHEKWEAQEWVLDVCGEDWAPAAVDIANRRAE